MFLSLDLATRMETLLLYESVAWQGDIGVTDIILM